MGKKEKGGSGGGGNGEELQDDGGAAPVVLYMDLHCEGCAKKIRDAIKNLPGVHKVGTDCASGTIVVAGNADAEEVKARIEAKARKPVAIVSAGGASKKQSAPAPAPAPAPAAGGGEGDAKKKQSSETTPPPPPPPSAKKGMEQDGERTVVFNMRLHCAECTDRITRRFYKFKGVRNVESDIGANLVTVKGMFDVAALEAYLKEKLSRSFEVVASPAKNGGGKADTEKGKGKEKAEEVGDGAKAPKTVSKDKKEDQKPAKAAKDDTGSVPAAAPAPALAAAAAMQWTPPTSVHMVEENRYMSVPVNWAGGYPSAEASHHYMPAVPAAEPYHVVHNNGYYGSNNYNYGYYNNHHQQPPPPPPYGYNLPVDSATQLFNDENPHACAIM